MSHVYKVTTFLFFAALGFSSAGANAQYIYWADRDGHKIMRATLDGAVVEDVITGLGDPYDVSVDTIAGRVYWVERFGGLVGWCDLDGGNPDTVAVNSIPLSIEVDTANRQLYWGGDGYDEIWRSDLDASGAERIRYTDPPQGLGNIALHVPMERYYWSLSGPDEIRFGRFDGSGGSFSPAAPVGPMAIDAVHDRIYWVTGASQQLFRSDPDGGGLQGLVATGNATAIAVDAVGQKVYWAVPDEEHIARANLDGSNVEIFVSGTFIDYVLGIDVARTDDCNGNGIPDACDLDCGQPAGPCDVPGCGLGDDCNNNGRLDECDLIEFGEDCNSNLVPDECDLSSGSSMDCNNDSIPDDCQLQFDCNANLAPDECDLASGASLDCNGSDVPDECELGANDCNANEVPDDCDVSSGASLDCNDNVIPDECEAAEFDCNNNEVPDDCDIANGTLTDSDGDGIPDECCPPPCEPGDPLLANTFGTCTAGVPANQNCTVGGPLCPAGVCDPCGQVRYISFGIPGNPPGINTAIRVKLTSLYDVSPPLSTSGVDPGPALAPFEGQYRYLNTIPGTFSRCCNPASNPTACNPSVTCNSDADCVGLGLNTKCEKNLCPDSAAFSTYFRCARLGCTPEYRDWGSDFSGLITYATGNPVVPDSTYHAAILAASCTGIEEICAAASFELVIKTERWGNIDCTQAEFPTAVDIGRLVDKVRDAPGAFIKPRTQLRDATPNPLGLVNAQDIARLVDSVRGNHYPASFPITQCP
jgi:hypothetical protein